MKRPSTVTSKRPFLCSYFSQILLKLIKLHDLPGVILEWRKLDNSVSKKICPLLNAYEHHPGLSMARIYSVCKTFNVNGRVYLNDPNIQNVPNDFEVVATPQLIRKALGQNESVNNKSELLLSYASLLVDIPQDEESYKVSLRKAFVASESCMIIAGRFFLRYYDMIRYGLILKKFLQLITPNWNCGYWHI